MELVHEYRRRAFEVEQLAETALSETHRETIRDIAKAWRSLAEQRERMLDARCRLARCSLFFVSRRYG